MALLLGVATALAYAAAYQPPVEVQGAGLSFTLPASWSDDSVMQKSSFGTQRVFTDLRRPSQRLGFTALDVSGGEQRGPVDPALMLRWVFLMRGVALP